MWNTSTQAGKKLPERGIYMRHTLLTINSMSQNKPKQLPTNRTRYRHAHAHPFSSPMTLTFGPVIVATQGCLDVADYSATSSSVLQTADTYRQAYPTTVPQIHYTWASGVSTEARDHTARFWLTSRLAPHFTFDKCGGTSDMQSTELRLSTNVQCAKQPYPDRNRGG